jgi:phi LC3 family holin
MDIKQRLRNKAFILSVIAFVVLIIKTFTNYKLPDNFDMLVNGALGLLSGMGILIDPTTDGISDKTE